MAQSPIFISYRRAHTRGQANLIHRELQRHFGDGVSFLDAPTIQPGQKWRDELQQAVAQCQVLLVLISRLAQGRASRFG